MKYRVIQQFADAEPNIQGTGFIINEQLVLGVMDLADPEDDEYIIEELRQHRVLDNQAVCLTYSSDTRYMMCVKDASNDRPLFILTEVYDGRWGSPRQEINLQRASD